MPIQQVQVLSIYAKREHMADMAECASAMRSVYPKAAFHISELKWAEHQIANLYEDYHLAFVDKMRFLISNN